MLRPKITLTYAQSLDGSIALTNDAQLPLSGPESMQMTHRLRANHDAILVGIGTVLADNPTLTTRLVAGANPQIVVIDGQLRTPPNANLLAGRPWIATTHSAENHTSLTQAGATLLRFRPNAQNQIPLPDLMHELASRGIQTLMVEGGATILSSFLAAALVDTVVVTIAPRFIGGVRVVDTLQPYPILTNVRWQQYGTDIVMQGDVV